MRLADAASFFDRTPCNDGYTGDFLFKCQLGLYDDTKRDSEASERRIVSTASGVTLPARRVIDVLGAIYILGKANPDMHDGEVIRQGIVAHEATGLAKIKTLAQASLGQTGVEAWGAHAWVKNKVFSEQSSDVTPEFHLFFSTTETIRKNLVIDYFGNLYIVRAHNVGASGIRVVTAEEIEATSLETGAVRAGYDSVLGTFSTSTQPVKLMRVRWQALFKYGSSLDTPFGPDEEQFIIAKSEFTATPGATVTLSSGTFMIKNVDSLEDVWICRVARHA